MIRACPAFGPGPLVQPHMKTDSFLAKLARAVVGVPAPFAGIGADGETTWRPVLEK